MCCSASHPFMNGERNDTCTSTGAPPPIYPPSPRQPQQLKKKTCQILGGISTPNIGTFRRGAAPLGAAEIHFPRKSYSSIAVREVIRCSPHSDVEGLEVRDGHGILKFRHLCRQTCKHSAGRSTTHHSTFFSKLIHELLRACAQSTTKLTRNRYPLR